MLITKKIKSLISKDKIDFYKSKYKYINTMFDNDKAGINSMNIYREKYDIRGILLNVEKDVAECSKQHGLKATKLFMTPLLKKELKNHKDEL